MLFSPPNCSLNLSVTCSVSNLARQGQPPPPTLNTNPAHMYVPMNGRVSEQFPLTCSLNLSHISVPPLDLQIIKASTTAREGTTTSSLRDLRPPRPRPQSISLSCPPQAPQAPRWEVWTTPCQGTIPPATCSASLTSCPTTRGTLPARSPESQGPCTASRPRCLAPARPLPHCR